MKKMSGNGDKEHYVHPSSFVDDGAIIGAGTNVWHFCHIQSGAVVGKNCTIGQNVNISNNVVIGDGCKIQNNVSIYEGVELEDYVFCGPSCVFTNVLTPRAKYPRKNRGYAKTLVKTGASIGANATIVCGHTIGEWAMIGAGAVVTSNVPAHALMLGVPAKRVDWMCECGERLRGALMCSICGRQYIETIRGIEPIADLCEGGGITVQFRDLKAQYRCLKAEIDEGIQEVVNSCGFILGEKVAQLENKLAAYVGRKHCISCANGTDALQLVLMAWGIGPGDAVFTSDFTFFASAGTSSILGATPVFVDIDSRTFNIDPGSLEKQIQRVIAEGKLKPKVIIPVDLFGLPADYDRIIPIAEKYGLKILEDGAQGFGGSIEGKMVCSFGEASTTSFFPAKPLGCYGDGGAIFTDDDQMDERLRSLRGQGRSPDDKYDNRCIGMNSRLDALQAAILLPKLDAFIDFELEASNKVAGWYTDCLKDKVVTPFVPDGFHSCWAQYTILLEDEYSRNALRDKLNMAKIPTMIYYTRGLHQQTAYKWMNLDDADYENTVYSTKRVLSLPMHPYLDKATVDEICSVITGG